MSRYDELIDKVENAHDWESGQTWGGQGTQLSCTDICRICGLNRHWFSDSQNGIHNRITFSTHDGESITLKDASELDC